MFRCKKITKTFSLYLKSKFSLQSLFAKLRSRNTRSLTISWILNGKMLRNFVSGFCALGTVRLKSSLKMPPTTSSAVSSVSRAGKRILGKSNDNWFLLIEQRFKWVLLRSKEAKSLLWVQKVSNIVSRFDVVRKNASGLDFRSPTLEPQVFC